MRFLSYRANYIPTTIVQTLGEATTQPRGSAGNECALHPKRLPVGLAEVSTVQSQRAGILMVDIQFAQG